MALSRLGRVRGTATMTSTSAHTRLRPGPRENNKVYAERPVAVGEGIKLIRINSLHSRSPCHTGLEHVVNEGHVPRPANKRLRFRCIYRDCTNFAIFCRFSMFCHVLCALKVSIYLYVYLYKI